MKVLMINANRFKQPWPVIPFGLSCVVASLEQAGYDVSVLDLCFSKNCAIDIKKRLSEYQPDIIGISIRNIDNSVGYNTLFLIENTKNEIVRPCKDWFKGPIVIGGPSVGISGAEMLSYLELDYAIRGDGEDAMVEFVKRYEDRAPFLGMQGLVIRETGKIIQDNPPKLVKDINEIPYVNPGRYINLKPYRKYDSPLQIQTKRGCALHCTYCTYNRIEGPDYRLKDPEIVANHIERLVKETGINHIEFTDSTFNIPLSHCKNILRSLLKKNLNLKLRTMGLNPGAIDEELVGLMAEVGFKDVDLGAESGSDVTLKSLGKNYTKAEVIRAGKLLQKKQIPITWYLLVGAPGESEETLKETFDTINQAASNWDLINFGIGIRVYNGSPLAQTMLSDTPACTRDNFLTPLHYSPDSLTLDEIKMKTKLTSFNHPNYFMYDEDENTPLALLAIGTFILRIIAPRQPIWRLHIILKKLQKLTGLSAVKKRLYLYKINRISSKTV